MAMPNGDVSTETPMAPVVTREAVAETCFFALLQRAAAGPLPERSLPDASCQYDELEQLNLFALNDTCEYVLGDDGRTILSALQQSGPGHAAARRLALLFARWRINRTKEDHNSLADSPEVQAFAKKMLAAAYAAVGEQPPSDDDDCHETVAEIMAAGAEARALLAAPANEEAPDVT